MSELLKKALQYLSRGFGFFLINLGVLLLILSFFTNSTLNNLSALENDLQGLAKEQINQSKDFKSVLEQAKEYCKLNPQDKNCDQLKDFNEDEIISESLGFNKLSESETNIKASINL